MGRAAGSPWPRLPSPGVRWEGFTVGPQAQVSRQTGREELVNLHPGLARPLKGDSQSSSRGSPAAGDGSGGMRPGEAAEGTESRRRQEGWRELRVQGRGGPGAETALHGQGLLDGGEAQASVRTAVRAQERGLTQ